MYRRELVFCALLLAFVFASPAMAQQELPAEAETEGRPFDVAWLQNQARELASRPYEPPAEPLPEAIADLDYDQYQEIRFRPRQALWRGEDLLFEIQLFHLGLYFETPVAIHVVEDGTARRVNYAREMFDYGGQELRPPLPKDLGFAGFRVHFHTEMERDLVAFLGASYFRAVGHTLQYGLSARGLAVDTGMPRPEEFPVFRAFWLEKPASGQTALVVHALLDSESVTGAYTFTIHPGRTTVMDVAATLYPRAPIERLGVAPLTSMYQHGENDRRVSDDFRPEIHDSDGLALWTGNGEWIWRPLVNPRELRANSFLDRNPRGFGLLQRDRDFENYQDDNVYYDRRPNLWVEPLEGFGNGAVQLFEIPTGEEIFDNIVAFWNPEQTAMPGEELRVAYRLYWGDEVPARFQETARVIATRTGIGGIPGQEEGRDTRKFVVDFKGGDLDLLPEDAKVEPVITTSRGEILKPAVWPVEELGVWRANFDLRADGQEPVDLRMFLRLGPMALTETWVYQWAPPPPPTQ